MIINKVHIDNFGKLSGLDLEFNNGLNQINAENGWGKTTLSIFLKAMFFGMSASRDNIKMERKKYLPWQGGNFGGFVEYSTSEGRFRLTRYFGKTPEGDSIQLVNLNTNQLMSLPKIEIGESLLGVGKDTFSMTAFFPQLNFLSIGSDKLNASILGLDKFKYDLANLTQATVNLKKKITDLKRDKPQKNEIENDKKEILRLKNDLVSIEKEIESMKVRFDKAKLEIEELSSSQIKVQQQVELQGKLTLTKQNLESELYSKIEEVKNLLLQLEELRINSQTRQPKKRLIWPYIVCVGGLVLLSIIMLSAFSIIKSPLSYILMVVVALLMIVVFVITERKADKKYLDSENENLDKKQDDIKNNVENIQKSIEVIKSTLDNYQDVEIPRNDILNSVNEELFNKKIEYEKLNNEISRLIGQRDNIIEKIDFWKDEVEKKEVKLKETDDKIELINLTREYLLKANENVSSRFVQPINKSIDDVLKLLDLDDRRFIIDTNLSIKEDSNFGIKDFEYSSQGYQDLLSFCMRFYLIKEIYKDEKPFIVLDDTFVNLDDEKMEKIKDIVKDFAKENQIIYICCHSRCKI